MTHECAHRLVQNVDFSGLDNGQWEEELLCDFFIGVREGLEHLSSKDFQAVCKGLYETQGGKSHPTGQLRYAVLHYAYVYVGNMDLIHGIKRSMREYIEAFDKWRNDHYYEIRQAQVQFYGY